MLIKYVFWEKLTAFAAAYEVKDPLSKTQPVESSVVDFKLAFAPITLVPFNFIAILVSAQLYLPVTVTLPCMSQFPPLIAVTVALVFSERKNFPNAIIVPIEKVEPFTETVDPLKLDCP